MEHHQGWPGIVHGGIISSLLYEVMENWPYMNGTVTMMRSMDTRLRKPASTVAVDNGDLVAGEP